MATIVRGPTRSLYSRLDHDLGLRVTLVTHQPHSTQLLKAADVDLPELARWRQQIPGMPWE